jgi:hypothetical protein
MQPERKDIQITADKPKSILHQAARDLTQMVLMVVHDVQKTGIESGPEKAQALAQEHFANLEESLAGSLCDLLMRSVCGAFVAEQSQVASATPWTLRLRPVEKGSTKLDIERPLARYMTSKQLSDDMSTFAFQVVQKATGYRPPQEAIDEANKNQPMIVTPR